MEGNGSTRDALRKVALMGRTRQHEVVQFEGVDYDVRQPTVGQRAKILAASRQKKVAANGTTELGDVDATLLHIHAVISCTFDPCTNTRVFEPADVDALLEDLTGGIVDVLGQVAMRLMNVTAPKAQAPSETTQSGAPVTQ